MKSVRHDTPHVSGLFVYPVKSCRGTELERADVDARGIRHDREYMVVDVKDRFLTQREVPRMALVCPSLDTGALHLEFPGMGGLEVSPRDRGAERQVVVFGDTCAAIDQGDQAAAWLTRALGQECRLVRMSSTFERPVDPGRTPIPDAQMGFSDAFPFHLTTEASLSDLNRRLAEPLPMDRFRPNIVVRGTTPYAEDSWRRLHIGRMTFLAAESCERCAITIIDQQTARRGKEPLRELARYRRRAKDGVFFGIYLVCEGGGTIGRGDAVNILA